MDMRLAQGVLIAAVLALITAAPAPAAKYLVDTDSVQAGPALAGSGVAWAEDYLDRPFEVKRAPLDAAPVTLYSVPKTGQCDMLADLAASAELVAIRIRRAGEDCVPTAYDTLVNDGAGGYEIVKSPGGCKPGEIDVEGTTIALANYCAGEKSVVLTDVAKGTSQPLDFTLPDEYHIDSIRLAGRYVAWSMGVMNGPWTVVVVWDRELDQEVFRVDGNTMLEAAERASRGTVELQSDGRVLLGLRGPGGEYDSFRYGWASPAEPTMHRVPGVFDTPWGHMGYPGRVGFAGDLVAAPLTGQWNAGVFGLDGATRSTLPLGSWFRSAVDFDGARTAWADRFHVYNEAHPYTAPKEEPPPTSPPPPVTPPVVTPKPFAVPAAVVIGKAVVKAKSLKSFRGTATDADGDLALVRVGLVRTVGKKCQTLQRSGRLKASKKVGGRCVPSAFHDATGTATWKLKLRKRLPAGRYTIYAQAVDAAGHAQTAGGMLTFKVR